MTRVFDEDTSASFQGPIRILGSEGSNHSTWEKIVDFAEPHSKTFECQASRKGFRELVMRVDIPEADCLTICFDIPQRCLGPVHIQEGVEKKLAFVKRVQERAKRVCYETYRSEIKSSWRNVSD